MPHIGLYCPAETGHLHTMLPLGRELQRRGHLVTFLGVPDAEEKVRTAQLDFMPIGATKFPLGTTEAMFAKLATLSGIRALLFTLNWIRESGKVFLEEAPSVLKDAQVDILIVDQITPEGGTVADFVGIPFVTVCSALPMMQEPSIPPFFTTWVYSQSMWNRWRNQLVYQLINPFNLPSQKLRQKYRQQWNLPREISPDSPYLILSHQPAGFEYPRQNLPPHFYFTGPYHSQQSRRKVDFPWNELVEGKPLIYASMGTLQTGLKQVFAKIAGACADLDVQLVISLGGSGDLDGWENLPGKPLVVNYAPQLELLQRAKLFITHGGMNSALEALTYGVPMVAIPITNDQPGIAGRIVWCGVGELVPLGQLTVSNLKLAINRVLNQPRYKQKALELQAEIRQSGGVVQAADLVEGVLWKK